MTGVLNVFLAGRLVGKLESDDLSRLVFSYTREWVADKTALPVSLYLPKRIEQYPDEIARPFFSNLLPEATVLGAVARKLGISSRNVFALLKALGGECAGAVTLLPPGVDIEGAGSYKPIDPAELELIIRQMPQKPFLAGDEGVRLSLAGAQHKLPVYIGVDRAVCLTSGTAPSSHILKPEIPGIPSSTRNEALCLDLARELGLPVPHSYLMRVGEAGEVLVIERYDRVKAEDRGLARLHQEDFCQALGFLPEMKYETEGGPDPAACFRLLEKYSASPARDRKTLLEWVVFNFLIHNADGHAKNLSILYSPEGIRLAPFYDLLCTGVYEGIAEKLAMRIGSENRPGWIAPRHWERLAKEIGIGVKLVNKTLSEMAEIIPAALGRVAHNHISAYGDDAIYAKIVAIVEGQARRSQASP